MLMLIMMMEMLAAAESERISLGRRTRPPRGQPPASYGVPPGPDVNESGVGAFSGFPRP
jgi:hypothetical protein